MIQVVYDKIVNFCGVPKIPCVIVGSKFDLSTISYVVSFFLPPKKDKVHYPYLSFFFFSVFFYPSFSCGVFRFFVFCFLKKNSSSLPYLSRQVDATDAENLAKQNDCAWIETSAKNNLNIGAFFPVLVIFEHKYVSFLFFNLWGADFSFFSIFCLFIQTESLSSVCKR